MHRLLLICAILCIKSVFIVYCSVVIERVLPDTEYGCDTWI